MQGWAEYWAIEPWGEYAANVRNAQEVCTLANINRDAKKRPEPFELKDFQLWRIEPTEKPKPVDEGAKIAPETAAWFFAMARKNSGD